MSNIFFASDHHFGHESVCTKFKRKDGSQLRPFSCAQEMDEEMIRRHNAVVGKHDKVYFLGDVAIAKKHIRSVSRLNGDKVLIKGNHDIYDLSLYTEHFRDIRSCLVLDGVLYAHIPTHVCSLYRFSTNIHGHLHENRVMLGESDLIDPRYFCVSMEHIDYTPIELSVLKQKVLDQGGSWGFRY